MRPSLRSSSTAFLIPQQPLTLSLFFLFFFCDRDRKSTRLNSSHGYISYAVFCLKKKKNTHSIKSSPAEAIGETFSTICMSVTIWMVARQQEIGVDDEFGYEIQLRCTREMCPSL